MKKSEVSIPANIAEGCGRGTDAQLVHFLDISLGSACELETHVIVAERLKFLGKNLGRGSAPTDL
ncbi:MAG: four helix bundle protein [Haliscomenobacteraceae bacterium CHB4]|nr:four helix bundle protein [Haliscomenobacteraceae bacterium CHB4]